jgi:hypothetical protein
LFGLCEKNENIKIIETQVVRLIVASNNMKEEKKSKRINLETK